MAAGFTMRGSHDFQKGNCDKVLLVYVSFPSPAACSHNLKVGDRAPLLTLSHRGHSAQHVFAVQTSASPKIPTLGFSGEVSEFDVGPISRLLLSTLPPGDSHCRIVQSQSEFRLI